MKKILAVTVLILTGCGGALDPRSEQCDRSGWEFWAKTKGDCTIIGPSPTPAPCLQGDSIASNSNVGGGGSDTTGAGGAWQQAQSFISTSQVRIHSVVVRLFVNVASSPQPTIAIKSDSSSTPGTSLGSVTYSSALTTTPTDYTFSFASSPPTISANTTYWIHLSSTALVNWTGNNLTDTYSGGNAMANKGSWSTSTGLGSIGNDFVFDVRKCK